MAQQQPNEAVASHLSRARALIAQAESCRRRAADEIVAAMAEDPTLFSGGSGPTNGAAVDGIVACVASEFGLRPDEMKKHCRVPRLVKARSVAMALARDLTDLSYPALGARFDRHHSTVIHAVRAVAEQRAADPAFDAWLVNIEEQLRDQVGFADVPA